MYKNNKISVTIPCLNEEDFIGKTLDSVPKFVDRIYVVDDGSTDGTRKVIKKYAKRDKRIKPLINDKNMGNGYSVVRGFKESVSQGFQICCIVAGDNQCRQEYLESLVSEVVEDHCDYAKANRFANTQELKQMPAFRKFGNVFMSFINKFATGYYSIFDPLNSYSAIRVSTLAKMDLDSVSHRYDFENSFLLHMYLVNGRVKDVPVPARYEGETSDIKLFSYTAKTTKTLFASFFKRIYYKYVLFSLHPIALLMFSGSLLFLFGLIYGLVIFVNSLQPDHIPATTATVMLSVVPFIVGFELLINAFVLDIQNEPKST
jgi:glycosyltransferase involved in cell wall biosynthesis